MTLTQNKIDQIIELWKELHNIAAIERILHLARNTVKKYLHEKGYLGYSYRPSSSPYHHTGEPHLYHSMTSTQRQQLYPQPYQHQTTYEYLENLARELEKKNQKLEQKNVEINELKQNEKQLREKLHNADQRVTDLTAEKEAEKRQKEEVQNKVNTLYEYIKRLQDEHHREKVELQHKMDTREQQFTKKLNEYVEIVRNQKDRETTLKNELDTVINIKNEQGDKIHILENQVQRLESEKENRGVKYVVVAIGGVIAGLIGGLAVGPPIRDWISNHLNQARAQWPVYDGYPTNNITPNQNQAISRWPVYGVDSLDYNFPNQLETNTRITMETNTSDTSYSGAVFIKPTEHATIGYDASQNQENNMSHIDIPCSETPQAMNLNNIPCSGAVMNNPQEPLVSGSLSIPNQTATISPTIDPNTARFVTCVSGKPSNGTYCNSHYETPFIP